MYSQPIFWLVQSIHKPKRNYNQEQYNDLNNHVRKLLKYAQTKPQETKVYFRALLCHPARKRIHSILQLPGPTQVK